MGYIYDAMQRGDTDPNRNSPPPPPAPHADELAGISLSQLTEQTAAGEATAAAVAAMDAAAATTAPAALSHDAPPPPLALPPSKGVDDRLHALTSPGSVMAEEYRAIRTSILARLQNRRHVVQTITSATPQEGKTITSLNLGLSFAELHNRSTIVVEADLRLPQFARLLPLDEGSGVVGLLEGQADLASEIRRIEGTSLCVLPAGRRLTTNAVQLLSSPNMIDLLKTLRQKFDHIIIDTPPVVELADAGILGAMSDEVLLIARMNRTPRSLIEQAVRTLHRYNAPVVGVIATDQSRRKHGYYDKYGYRYGYHYADRYGARAA